MVNFSLLLLFTARLVLALVATSEQGESELELIASRRKIDLATFPPPGSLPSIDTWLSDQKDDGTWEDVNYASGCGAQRANWPIQSHWIRTITFAAAYTGLNPSVPQDYTGSAALLDASRKAMDWWFERDYTNPACIGNGGTNGSECPCGTPGLWNSNWFGQVILIPQLVSISCLLLSDHLTASERKGCYDIPIRGYLLKDTEIPGLGPLTGANTISVMQNIVNVGLYTNNATLLREAFDIAMSAVTFSDAPAADGIHRDGSFLQHEGILYNGNYGKDLLNAFIQLEGAATGTSFAANETVREAFTAFMRGNEWMIYTDEERDQQHWDLNTVGRFIAFNTADVQAISDINFNVSKLSTATAAFTGADDLSDTVRRIASNGTEQLLGNKGFYAADYMVHRRDSFIITNKMISTRSHNTEYTNSANPYGYHLGQGSMFTYVNGYEYRDIEAEWDWNLIPGTTVQLGQPTLKSSIVGFTGLLSWVGGVSDGWVGISVMDYLDPYDQSLQYKKSWFFMDDSVIVTVSGVQVDDSATPVVSVLDNRAAAPGGVWVDGEPLKVGVNGTAVNATTLFYGGNGYLSYDQPFQLTVAEGNRTGNWSAISTSAQGVKTANIFSAYTTLPATSDTSYSYAMFPASTPDRLAQEVASPSLVPINGDGVHGVVGSSRLGLVFWPEGELTSTVTLEAIGWGSTGTITVTSAEPAAYLFAKRDDGTVVITVADPSQGLMKVSFEIKVTDGAFSCSQVDWQDGCRLFDGGVAFDEVPLPEDGFAGSSVFREIKLT